ncbi:GNAT family N-acetyltransferase [Streptomyces sp. NPDC059443]|uniref:GNAT family N-acetyltransferase n=1 Tax=unclassified Streptomyces TaxID=2593676 RepID=UPI0036844C1D
MELHAGEVKLRELHVNDAPEVHPWFHAENLVHQGLLEPSPGLVQQALTVNETNTREDPRTKYWLGIEHHGQLVGCVTLAVIAPGTGDLGWMLHSGHRGHGYATRAATALMDYGFGTLGLTRIQATPHPDNTASRAVAERIGMTQEHVQADAVMYAVTASG